MVSALLYVLVLAWFAPGLWLTVRWRLLHSFTVPTVYFLCTFVFLGLGSFYVIWSEALLGGTWLTATYIVLLLLHPTLFYVMLALRASARPVADANAARPTPDGLLHIARPLWAISLPAVALYVALYGSPPLLQHNLMTLGYAALISLRTAATVQSDAFSWFQIAFYDLPTLATVALYCRHRLLQTRRSRVVYVASFALTAVLLISFLHMTPLVLLLGSMWLAAALESGRVSMGRVLAFGVLALIGLSALYVVYNPGRSLEFYLTDQWLSILHRIIGSYTVSLAVVADFFRADPTALGGRTMVNPLGLLPFEPVNLGNLSHALRRGFAGSSPVPPLGEGYANFGWLGVVAFSGLVIGSLAIAQRVVEAVRSPELRLLLVIAFSLIALDMSINSPFRGFFAPTTLASLAVIGAAGYLFAPRRRSEGRVQADA